MHRRALLPLLSVGLLLQAAPEASKGFSPKEQQLWANTVTLFLKRPLWKDYSAYTATHLIMVPMHAAFAAGAEPQLKEFDDHFAALAPAFGRDEVAKNPGVRLQYEYFATRYLALCSAYGRKPAAGLQEAVEADLRNYWTTLPAEHWAVHDLKGIRSRVIWKIETVRPAKQYYRGIVDQDLYPVAAAADLAIIYRSQGKPVPAWIQDALSVGYRAMKEFSVFSANGGWIFQPGGLADHPDYAYAGQPAKVKGMDKAYVPTLAWDVSHSHRFPLWLVSWVGAHPQGTPEGDFYRKVQKEFRIQFYGKVLVAPTPDFPAYRTTNYMDGRNGVYRWGYKAIGPDKGYGPYELSGTLLLGWWAFLGDAHALKVYQQSLAAWPFPPKVWSVYAGEDESDEGQSAFNDTNNRGTQFRELDLRMVPYLTFSK